MKVLQLANYNIHVGTAWNALASLIEEHQYDQVMVLVDENTKKHCLPIFQKELSDLSISIIQIKSGEKNKNIDTCQFIWNQMMTQNLSRRSLLINLGGGVIGDMGGFCAATFKRGIDFIQIPTTLLSQVDASIGGKLGIDFNELKNSIGLFANPKAVFINTQFLESLPERELRSGFAEMLKHSLIADAKQWQYFKGLNDLSDLNWDDWIVSSLEVKRKIVEQDPFEKGIRKVLNFGHTVGHAVESYFLETKQPLLHGEAVALGIVVESYLSFLLHGISQEDLDEIRRLISTIYGKKTLKEASFDQLIQFMRGDKKNEDGQINFSLLESIGGAIYNQNIEEIIIREALSFYANR